MALAVRADDRRHIFRNQTLAPWILICESPSKPIQAEELLSILRELLAA